MKRSVKRGLIWTGAAVGVLALVAVLLYALFPNIARWYVRSRVIPRYEKLLGRDIHVDKITVTRGHIELEGIRVSGPGDDESAALLQVARVTTDFDFWLAVRGHMKIGPVLVTEPRATLVVAKDGTDNWSDVVERVRKRRSSGAAGDAQGAKKSRFERADLDSGSLKLIDRAHGIEVNVGDMDGSYVPHGDVQLRVASFDSRTSIGPAAGVELLTITASADDPRGTLSVDVIGGRAELGHGVALTGIHGTVAPAPEDGEGHVRINLEGGYGGVEETLWHADGWLDRIEKRGEVHVRAERFTLDKLASVLEGGPLQKPEKTSLSWSLDLTLVGDVLDFDGSIDVAGLTIYHPWVAPKALPDLAFNGEVKGRYNHGARRFELDNAALQFRGVEGRIEGYVAFAGGKDDDGVVREKPRLRARVVVPEITCQKALKAFPPEFAPKFRGFKLQGKFKTDVAIDINWADLEALELGGSVGIYGCKVLEAPKSVDTERLLEEFEQEVEVEKDKYIKFMVGPSNPDFVPIADVSPYLINSFLTTEDGLFYKHKGFIVSEFRTAIIKNLQAGYFKYGASSITMQFVKNVMLHRQKTAARKLQELFLTWYVEQTMEKDRIMEIYLNVIEFGPGIYGIGPAAHHYFGKSAKDLTPLESAFFSTILPGPKKRHMQYCEGKLKKWTEAKIQRILKLAYEKERLTELEYLTASTTEFAFVYPPDFDEKACKKMTEKAIKNSRKTMPEPDDEPEDATP